MSEWLYDFTAANMPLFTPWGWSVVLGALGAASFAAGAALGLYCLSLRGLW